jgi:hypothetical protein
MTVTRFNVSDLIQANAFLGPFCFFIFMLLVVFICLNMFLSIINASFHRARQNQAADEEILSFTLKKFLSWSGKSKCLSKMLII